MTAYRIALIPGDGIGAEVLPPARALLDAAGRRHGITFTYDAFDWSCRRYLAEGAMMPDDGLRQIRGHDAVLLGAVGWPGVPDHVSLWGLLIPIRRAFRQYVNLRPIKVLDGVPSPLRDATGVDLVVVRENVEGEYSEIGGRLGRGTEDELAVQEAVFTRRGVTRVVEYAYTLAESRGKPGGRRGSARRRLRHAGRRHQHRRPGWHGRHRRLHPRGTGPARHPRETFMKSTVDIS
ncbi:isocitrate/isopropylmalate family dehydrogenase [Actinoplanes missouriensis]|uniref:isocitrate/isopropylmalate family dehydrogenase n=1 Tax=Actinoplanes missouriensis TaxID=1866 RepID=UPI0034091690